MLSKHTASSSNDLTLPLAVGLSIGICGLIVAVLLVACCLCHKANIRRHNRYNDSKNDEAQPDWLPLSQIENMRGTQGRYVANNDFFKPYESESGYNSVTSRPGTNENEAYIDNETIVSH